MYILPLNNDYKINKDPNSNNILLGSMVDFLKVGDLTFGGVVLYIFPDRLSVLISAIDYIPIGWQSWGSGSTTGCSNNFYGGGYQNTIDIVNSYLSPQPPTPGVAGNTAWDYVYGGYDDWYLPCIIELQAMYNLYVSKGLPHFTLRSWTSNVYSEFQSYRIDAAGSLGFVSKGSQEVVLPIRRQYL